MLNTLKRGSSLTPLFVFTLLGIVGSVALLLRKLDYLLINHDLRTSASASRYPGYFCAEV